MSRSIPATRREALVGLAATQNFAVQEMSLGIHYNGSEDLGTLMTNPDLFALSNGTLSIPEEPGPGVNIDEAAIRETARDPHRWRNPVWRGPDGELRER